MEWRKVDRKAVAQDSLIRRSTSDRSVRQVWRSFLYLGIVGILLTEGKCVAQFSDDSMLEPGMSVRPREMATQTRTEQAGEFELESFRGSLVYVPQQCVGTRRCPLVVFNVADTHEGQAWGPPVADKYGMIVLMPNRWLHQGMTGQLIKGDLDAALTEILRKFAIDPDKIAIMGRCGTSGEGLYSGGNGGDVFSPIALISGSIPPLNTTHPPSKTTEFFVDAGFLESDGNFQAARTLREAGYQVKLAMALRGHEHQVEDYDFLGRWLQESWAVPNPAARPTPSVVADPLPLLTTEALTQMTTFWTSFLQEPESIRTTARRAYLREALVPVGKERSSVWIVDMPGLAAKYPSVAAGLKKAGLTAQQHEAYRVALLSAIVTQSVGDETGTVEATSVLGKNIAFMEAHSSNFEALETAGVAQPDKANRTTPRNPAYPSEPDSLGGLGIWRTP